MRALPKNMRGYNIQRCRRCWMETSQCICSLLPRIQTNTRIVIVMHWRESCRSSNTGRLAHLVLTNSEIRLRASPLCSFDSEGMLDPAHQAYILFPAEEAIELSGALVPQDNKGLTLVVPDGSWRQARRTWRHERSLSSLQPVKLPQSTRSIYHLRKSPSAGHLCTYESIARALDILEFSDIEQQMLPALQEMVRRSLLTRGRRSKINFP